MNLENIEKLARLIRYYILVSSTTAGSGHPTSSLSAADLLTVLMFGNHYNFDFKNPDNPANDRLIFSKGHATPLYYSLYLAAGQISSQEILTVRKFDSPLEGHPTPRFKFTEAATGSLGQGLSVGVGMALAIKNRFKNYDLRFKNEKEPSVFVLLGDGEMAEGSVWEAANLASYYKLNNLTAIVDVNRLGQSQETSLGWDVKSYNDRFAAFGWKTITINGHKFEEIEEAYKTIYDLRFKNYESKVDGKPIAIIAKTIKGKGVSFLENKDGWHGKPLGKEDLEKALKELGEVDLEIRGEINKPINKLSNYPISNNKSIIQKLNYKLGEEVATRKAYGNALKRLGGGYPNIVSLDGDVKNSTYSEIFKESFPDRFFEMFIAEQNMVGVGVGMARLGFIPFVSSFACFLTRGFDQIRMASIGEANVKFCGSHAGVSIGEDGPSQMGLEDISMFRSIHGSAVLYPSDAVSTEKLIEEMINHKGISYIRTTRPGMRVIYDNAQEFKIGGSKVHRLKNPRPKADQPMAEKSKLVIIAAGITLFEAFKAQEELSKEGIEAIVVDCYSIKPIDEKTLKELAKETSNFITVEDHWSEGGLGDAVLNVFADDSRVKIHKLAVYKKPRSGKASELMAYEEIDAEAIVKKAKELNV